MVVVLEGVSASAHRHLFDAMFEDRKKLFIDLLKWNIPALADRFEMDAFDSEDAIYLIALDDNGGHAGSMRLLPTIRSHILGQLFPSLCDGPVPADPSTFEITRLCLPARHSARERLAIRNRLISAMVDHALKIGIDRLTGVVEASFLTKVLAMGWRARKLGHTQRLDRSLLGAFEIRVDRNVPIQLAATGIYVPGTIAPAPAEQVAA
jgi:acyl-homoserine lactone synthase